MSADAFSIDLDEGGGGAFDLDKMLADDPPAGGTGTGEGGEGGTGAGTGNEDVEAARRANKVLMDQLAQQQRQIEDLQRRQSTFDTSLREQPTRQPAQPPQQAFDVDQFKNSMADLLAKDPGEYTIRLFEAARRSVEQDMMAKFGGVATTTASLETQNFLASKRSSDEAFDDATAEAFNELAGSPQFAAGIANSPPEIRRQTLELIYDAAAGRAARKRGQTQERTQREITPPSIGGGQNFPLATGVSMTYGGKPLNGTQREILRMAQESGITDKKRIKAMLDDAAEA